KSSDKPVLIEVKTIIGYGSPNKQGKSASHGAPLGADERNAAFEHYGFDPGKTFEVDKSVYDRFSETLKMRSNAKEAEWIEVIENYATSHPELHKEFEDANNGILAAGYDSDLPYHEAREKKATRATSSEMLQVMTETVPT